MMKIALATVDKKSNRNPRHAFNLPQFIKPRNSETREALIYQKSVPYLRFNVFRDEIFETLNTLRDTVKECRC